MTATVERGVQISIFSTIGGIGAAISLLWMATHGGIELAFSLKCAKTLIGIVTAGGLPAAVCNWLFERYCWRYSIFQGWLIKVPDLSGIWEGPSISDYFKNPNTGEPACVHMTAKIDHRFHDLIYEQEALTKSLVLAADLSIDSKDRCELIVSYENYPQIVDDRQKGGIQDDRILAKNSRAHIGTHLLILSRPPGERKASIHWTLAGDYWTDKERIPHGGDRGTTGRLHLTWKSPLPKAKLLVRGGSVKESNL